MSSILFGDTMLPNVTPIMENQMEKRMENEMEAGIICGLNYFVALQLLFGDTLVPNIE